MIERYWIYDDYRECPGTGELFVVIYMYDMIERYWIYDEYRECPGTGELFVVLYSTIWSNDTESTMITVSALALGSCL